jgi:hypothetical protein
MAAGGFREFVAGEVLDENEINDYLMQGVLVFAGTAARGSAITAPVEGQFSFLKDSDSVEFFDGSQWVEFSVSPTDFEYLIIAGGGGGGQTNGGGGGAGGYLGGTAQVFGGINYTITVGAGGSGGIWSPPGRATNGNRSTTSFLNVRDGIGGGAGGSRSNDDPHFAASSGGSSGGTHGQTTLSFSGTLANPTGQGNNGGSNSLGAANFGAGGGGGAGAVGGNGTGSASGAGGNGLASSITGSSVTRAGGGGGGSTASGASRGVGGTGGGGDGGTSGNAGANGTVNTGGGAGGGSDARNGGNGGSGIVVLKYPDSITLTIGDGLTSSTTTSGGFKITSFTAGTDVISF